MDWRRHCNGNGQTLVKPPEQTTTFHLQNQTSGFWGSCLGTGREIVTGADLMEDSRRTDSVVRKERNPRITEWLRLESTSWSMWSNPAQVETYRTRRKGNALQAESDKVAPSSVTAQSLPILFVLFLHVCVFV